jgi:hypothetical protein
MKLSVVKILSEAIAIQLVVVTLIATNSASAEKIDRSRSFFSRESRSRIDESMPLVTDLNLSIPVVIVSADEDRGQSSSERSTLSGSRRKNLTTSKQSKTIESVSRQTTVLTTSDRRNTIVAMNPSNRTSMEGRESSKVRSIPKYKVAAISPPPLSRAYLRLVRDPSKGTNSLGNPIHTLEIYLNGKKYQTFNAISGTVNTQNRDRNVANTFAPLPDGLYSINGIVPGAIPEIGKTFIVINPKFATDRSDLGIHVDPSFNKRNGYDGTAGCIGLTTVADRDAVNEFVMKYRPRNLNVEILSKLDRDRG